LTLTKSYQKPRLTKMKNLHVSAAFGGSM
jgi:hypothetical protein